MATSIIEYFDQTDQAFLEDTYRSVGAGNTPTFLAQTFTLGTTGLNTASVLESIELKLSKDGTPTGNLTVEIRDVDVSSKPNNVLAVGTIAISDITATSTFLSCTNLRGTLNLTASTMYAIVVYHTNANATDHIELSGDGAGGGGGYSGGAGYWTSDGGTTWTLNSAGIDAEDFFFKVFGSPYTATLATYEDVVNKAGANANSTARGVSNVENYVKLVESTINGLTRYNWISVYSALSADVKLMINEVVSNLAAIKVINYDMSNYTTRLEAEDMKATLQKESTTLINSLIDPKVQTFLNNA